MSVEWQWLDKNRGVVLWRIRTNGKYMILNRGVKVGDKCLEVYTFGEAYYPAYLTLNMAYWVDRASLDNLTYEVPPIPSSTLGASMAGNEGIGYGEVMPIAVVEDAKGTRAVGFIFNDYASSTGDKELLIPEGGFVNGVEPCGARLIEVEPQEEDEYIILYRYYSQCIQFVAQAGVFRLCPYPVVARTVKFRVKDANERVKPIISDKIWSIEEIEDLL